VSGLATYHPFMKESGMKHCTQSSIPEKGE